MRVLKLNFARAIGFRDGGRVPGIGGGVGYPPKTPYNIINNTINNIKSVYILIKVCYNRLVNSERKWKDDSIKKWIKLYWVRR